MRSERMNIRQRLRSLVLATEPLDILLVISAIVLAYGLSLIHPAAPWVVIGALGVFIWAQAT